MQYNMVPAVKGQWCFEAGKVAVFLSLASYWPCVTDSMICPPTGSTAIEREMSTPPMLLMGHGPVCVLTLWPSRYCYLISKCTFCYSYSQPACLCVYVQGRLPYLYGGAAAAAAANDQLSQPPPAHMGIPPLHLDHKTGLYRTH